MPVAHPRPAFGLRYCNKLVGTYQDWTGISISSCFAVLRFISRASSGSDLQVARLRALQDGVDIVGGVPIDLRAVRAYRQQGAVGCEFGLRANHRDLPVQALGDNDAAT